MQPTYENISEEARQNLETKMQRIISGCGLASSAADRFILTARVDITEKEINTAGIVFFDNFVVNGSVVPSHTRPTSPWFFDTVVAIIYIIYCSKQKHKKHKRGTMISRKYILMLVFYAVNIASLAQHVNYDEG